MFIICAKYGRPHIKVYLKWQVFESKIMWYCIFMQGATTRLPDCSGQSIFGSGNLDLQKSCPTGQVKIISKLTLILSHMLQTSKIILASYKPSTYFNLLTQHICYLAKFGQAVLWPSLPDRATKKKENCRSLFSWTIIFLSARSRVFSLNFWWGELKIFHPRRSPTDEVGWGGLAKKSDKSQNCPLNAKLGHFLLF